VWTGERYLLPGERVASQPVEAQPERELEPPPAFEVLGTASSGASGLAIIRVGNGTPQLVALGQRVEGYEVASIEGERVTMRNTERSLSLSVASASPTGPVNERNDRRGPTRNRDNDRGNANDPRAVRNTGARAIPGVANGAIEAM